MPFGTFAYHFFLQCLAGFASASHFKKKRFVVAHFCPRFVPRSSAAYHRLVPRLSQVSLLIKLSDNKRLLSDKLKGKLYFCKVVQNVQCSAGKQHLG